MHRIALLFDIKHPHKIYFKTIYNFSQPVVEMFFLFLNFPFDTFVCVIPAYDDHFILVCGK